MQNVFETVLRQPIGHRVWK